MRDGVRLFTAVYVPKDTTQTYPDLLDRTPYSVAPYGVDNYPDRTRPLREVRARGLHLRLPGRARRWMMRRRVRQRAPALAKQERAEGHRREHRHLRHHRLAGEERAEQQRPVGMWGISYPGFYTAAGDHRRPSRAQGRLAAGAHHRLVHRRRLPPQRRASSCRTRSDFFAVFGQPRPEPTKPPPAGSVDSRQRRTATTSSSTLGPLANAEREVLQERRRRSGTR